MVLNGNLPIQNHLFITLFFYFSICAKCDSRCYSAYIVYFFASFFFIGKNMTAKSINVTIITVVEKYVLLVSS